MSCRFSKKFVPGDSRLLTFTRAGRLDQAGELISVAQRLSLARSLSEVQTIVARAARRVTGADGATFVMRDGDYCFYADEDAISSLWKGQRFPLESCISGWVMRNRQSTAIEDIYKDERITHEAYRPTFVKSLAMVPIRQLRPIGAIGNYWASTHRPTEHELALLQALADSTAVAIENVYTYQHVEAARIETLQRLALAAEYRDDGTHEHTERVARTAFLLAEAVGLSERERALIHQAAPLHDLGKLAVGDAVLLKPGRLSAPEFEQVKKHPRAGAAILTGSASEVLQLAEEVAYTHHEWWNGSGYPDGLEAEEIPISGRIVALADVFDALTHTRPYKQAWPIEAALAELKRLRGRQFDPELLDEFLELNPGSLVELTDAWRESAPSSDLDLLSAAPQRTRSDDNGFPQRESMPAGE